MGRIVDLCGEVAAAADEGPEGLILPPEAWDRLRDDWEEEDIEDALGLVRDSLLQGELVEAAESLSTHLVEVLGAFGEAKAFEQAVAGHTEAPFSLGLVLGITRGRPEASISLAQVVLTNGLPRMNLPVARSST